MFLKLQIIIFFMNYLCDTRTTTTDGTYESEYYKNKQYEIEKQEYLRRAMKGPNLCAEEPHTIYDCLPKLKGVKRSAYEECGLEKEDQIIDCKPYQCVYDNIGTELKPGPFRKYVQDFVSENPVMEEAANFALTNCTEVKLEQQGLMKDCSAYDIHVCFGKEIIKNMPISLWEPNCMKEREYLTRCTVCPTNCRAQLYIKPGTCAACADF